MQPEFRITDVKLFVRMIQGYRYLDRCGELLIRLENDLGADWIPHDIAPSGGLLANRKRNMNIGINSESFQISQHFEVDRDDFLRLGVQALEIVLRTLEVSSINIVSMQFNLQMGFPRAELERAIDLLNRMRLAEIAPGLLETLGGDLQETNLILISKGRELLGEVERKWRQRLSTSVAIQQGRKTFDQRALRRPEQLTARERLSLDAESLPFEVYPVAIQIGLERTLEEELLVAELPFAECVTQSWDWVKQVQKYFNSVKSRTP